MRISRLAVAAGLAGAVAAFAAAPAISATPSTVKVTLSEFKVVTGVPSVKAGKVTFAITNKGKLTHEFVVLKTTKTPAQLKQKDGRANEASSLGESGDVAAGKTGKATLTLTPGHYLLICNLPGHFTAGQFRAFTVN
jgi:uncharacterized cupredoxin-like copper-binding protein